MRNWIFKDTGSGQTLIYDEKTGKSIAVFYDPKEAERLRDYLEASLNHSRGKHLLIKGIT